MAAHSVAVGSKSDGVAVHDPLRLHVEVRRQCEIMYFRLAGSVHHGHIAVRFVAIAGKFKDHPLAVGRP